MKKIGTFLFFFFFIFLAVGLMIVFRWGADFHQNNKPSSKKVAEKKKEKTSKKEKKPSASDVKKQEKTKEKKENKAEKSEEKDPEKKEEKVEKQHIKPERESTKVLDRKKRQGRYWLMIDYSVTEKEDGFEVSGSVYDAALYSIWVDEVGSDGLEEGEKAKGKDGFVAKNVNLKIPKDLRVGVQKIEWFEIKEKSVKEFFEGEFGTFLFENEGEQITEMLDWYMNYSG